jgi:hypothetical protein
MKFWIKSLHTEALLPNASTVYKWGFVNWLDHIEALLPNASTVYKWGFVNWLDHNGTDPLVDSSIYKFMIEWTMGRQWKL